ncbi:MAG: hypothetical protein ABIR66_12045 [Saprospiraceae bacterium]
MRWFQNTLTTHPATVQEGYGLGWVVLIGVHPEAPESWRKDYYFTTPMEASHKYALMFIKAGTGKNTVISFLKWS